MSVPAPRFCAPRVPLAQTESQTPAEQAVWGKRSASASCIRVMFLKRVSAARDGGVSFLPSLKFIPRGAPPSKTARLTFHRSQEVLVLHGARNPIWAGGLLGSHRFAADV